MVVTTQALLLQYYSDDTIFDCDKLFAGSKSLSKAPNGAFPQPDVDSDSLNMLPTEEELLTCDCPFCVAYRGRSDSIRGAVAGKLLCRDP